MINVAHLNAFIVIRKKVFVKCCPAAYLSIEYFGQLSLLAFQTVLADLNLLLLLVVIYVKLLCLFCQLFNVSFGQTALVICDDNLVLFPSVPTHGRHGQDSQTSLIQVHTIAVDTPNKFAVVLYSDVEAT